MILWSINLMGNLEKNPLFNGETINELERSTSVGKLLLELSMAMAQPVSQSVNITRLGKSHQIPWKTHHFPMVFQWFSQPINTSGCPHIISYYPIKSPYYPVKSTYYPNTSPYYSISGAIAAESLQSRLAPDPRSSARRPQPGHRDVSLGDRLRKRLRKRMGTPGMGWIMEKWENP